MRSLIAFILLALLSVGCASTPAPVETHRQGWFDRLSALQPASHSRVPAKVTSTAAGRAPADLASNTPLALTKIRDLGLSWPLTRVQITSPFGQRGRTFHEGVDLRARAGTPVYAAHSGQVIYAGDRIRGYGKMIVLKHSSGIATIYAHNSKLLVHKGQWITQGSKISISGNTGHSHGAHLHFEIRSGVAAVDPVRVVSKNARGGRNRLIATSQ